MKHTGKPMREAMKRLRRYQRRCSSAVKTPENQDELSANQVYAAQALTLGIARRIIAEAYRDTARGL